MYVNVNCVFLSLHFLHAAMPESSTWQDICRWDFQEEEEEIEEEDPELLDDEDDDDDILDDDDSFDSSQEGDLDQEEQQLASARPRLIRDDDLTSTLSEISQQDRDNKIILLSSSTTGRWFISLDSPTILLTLSFINHFFSFIFRNISYLMR